MFLQKRENTINNPGKNDLCSTNRYVTAVIWSIYLETHTLLQRKYFKMVLLCKKQKIGYNIATKLKHNVLLLGKVGSGKTLLLR